MTRVLNTDPSLNRVTLASNACRVKEPVSVRESWSLHIKPIEWMGELGELGGRGSVPSETFCPPFNSRYWDGASYTHVKSCDGFFSFFGVYLSHSHCLCPFVFLPTSREAGAENWGTEGCQTLTSTTVHTKCLCSRISTYTVLAQQAKDPVSH